jgi:hypothetical protein
MDLCLILLLNGVRCLSFALRAAFLLFLCSAGSGTFNCTGSPTPPANAKPFTCVGGTACSTTCNAGYSLTSGSLTAVCINGSVPAWSVATGVCSPASELCACDAAGRHEMLLNSQTCQSNTCCSGNCTANLIHALSLELLSDGKAVCCPTCSFDRLLLPPRSWLCAAYRLPESRPCCSPECCQLQLSCDSSWRQLQHQLPARLHPCAWYQLADCLQPRQLEHTDWRLH